MLSKRLIQINSRDENYSLLSKLAIQFGSDKGGYGELSPHFQWPHHTYTDIYTKLFLLGRHCIRNVFECGLGTNNPNIESNMSINGSPGASLRMWREFFPNAQIYGADIDREILFEEPRIKTYYVDQRSASSILKMWQEIGKDNFDVLIDDGLHTFEAGTTLFENSYRMLRKEGVYIIEDVSASNLLRYQEYFAKTNFRIDYVQLSESQRFMYDNNLVIIWKA